RRSPPSARHATAGTPSPLRGRSRGRSHAWVGSGAPCRGSTRPAAAPRRRPARAPGPSHACERGARRSSRGRSTRAPAPRASKRGHRPRLQQVELAALDRPLDVLRPSELLLEVAAELREPSQLVWLQDAAVDELLALDTARAVDDVVV